MKNIVFINERGWLSINGKVPSGGTFYPVYNHDESQVAIRMIKGDKYLADMSAAENYVDNTGATYKSMFALQEVINPYFVKFLAPSHINEDAIVTHDKPIIGVRCNLSQILSNNINLGKGDFTVQIYAKITPSKSENTPMHGEPTNYYKESSLQIHANWDDSSPEDDKHKPGYILFERPEDPTSPATANSVNVKNLVNRNYSDMFHIIIRRIEKVVSIIINGKETTTTHDRILDFSNFFIGFYASDLVCLSRVFNYYLPDDRAALLYHKGRPELFVLSEEEKHQLVGEHNTLDLSNYLGFAEFKSNSLHLLEDTTSATILARCGIVIPTEYIELIRKDSPIQVELAYACSKDHIFSFGFGNGISRNKPWHDATFTASDNKVIFTFGGNYEEVFDTRALTMIAFASKNSNNPVGDLIITECKITLAGCVAEFLPKNIDKNVWHDSSSKGGFITPTDKIIIFPEVEALIQDNIYFHTNSLASFPIIKQYDYHNDNANGFTDKYQIIRALKTFSTLCENDGTRKNPFTMQIDATKDFTLQTELNLEDLPAANNRNLLHNSTEDHMLYNVDGDLLYWNKKFADGADRKTSTFAGSGSGAQLAEPFEMAAGSFIEFVADLSTVPTAQYLFGFSEHNNHGIRYSYSDKTFLINTDATASFTYTPEAGLHVYKIACIDNTTYNIYADGVIIGSWINSNLTALRIDYIGRCEDGYYFVGNMHDINFDNQFKIPLPHLGYGIRQDNSLYFFKKLEGVTEATIAGGSNYLKDSFKVITERTSVTPRNASFPYLSVDVNSGSRTISLWLDGYESFERANFFPLVVNGTASTASIRVLQNSRTSIAVYNRGNVIVGQLSANPDNPRHFVIILDNANKHIDVYCNGVLITHHNNPGNRTNSDIGHILKDLAANYHFKGDIYHQRIFNYAATQEQVTALYNAGRVDRYELPTELKQSDARGLFNKQILGNSAIIGNDADLISAQLVGNRYEFIRTNSENPHIRLNVDLKKDHSYQLVCDIQPVSGHQLSYYVKLGSTTSVHQSIVNGVLHFTAPEDAQGIYIFNNSSNCAYSLTNFEVTECACLHEYLGKNIQPTKWIDSGATPANISLQADSLVEGVLHNSIVLAENYYQERNHVYTVTKNNKFLRLYRDEIQVADINLEAGQIDLGAISLLQQVEVNNRYNLNGSLSKIRKLDAALSQRALRWVLDNGFLSQNYLASSPQLVNLDNLVFYVPTTLGISTSYDATNHIASSTLVNSYTSDFSAGVDGWTVQHAPTADIAISTASNNLTLSINTPPSADNQPILRKPLSWVNSLAVGSRIRVSFKNNSSFHLFLRSYGFFTSGSVDINRNIAQGETVVFHIDVADITDTKSPYYNNLYLYFDGSVLNSGDIIKISDFKVEQEQTSIQFPRLNDSGIKLGTENALFKYTFDAEPLDDFYDVGFSETVRPEKPYDTVGAFYRIFKRESLSFVGRASYPDYGNTISLVGDNSDKRLKIHSWKVEQVEIQQEYIPTNLIEWENKIENSGTLDSAKDIAIHTFKDLGVTPTKTPNISTYSKIKTPIIRDYKYRIEILYRANTRFYSANESLTLTPNLNTAVRKVIETTAVADTDGSVFVTNPLQSFLHVGRSAYTVDDKAPWLEIQTLSIQKVAYIERNADIIFPINPISVLTDFTGGTYSSLKPVHISYPTVLENGFTSRYLRAVAAGNNQIDLYYYIAADIEIGKLYEFRFKYRCNTAAYDKNKDITLFPNIGDAEERVIRTRGYKNATTTTKVAIPLSHLFMNMGQSIVVDGSNTPFIEIQPISVRRVLSESDKSNDFEIVRGHPYQNILRKSGVPIHAPDHVYQHYINIDTGVTYIADNTSSVADWKENPIAHTP